jgi:hypothetical protein
VREDFARVMLGVPVVTVQRLSVCSCAGGDALVPPGLVGSTARGHEYMLASRHVLRGLGHERGGPRGVVLFFLCLTPANAEVCFAL